MAIRPGARKVIKGKPNTSPLSFPIANESTSKNRSDVTSGDIMVWIITIKNLSTSFLYSVQNPIQFTLPNFFSDIYIIKAF